MFTSVIAMLTAQAIGSTIGSTLSLVMSICSMVCESSSFLAVFFFCDDIVQLLRYKFQKRKATSARYGVPKTSEPAIASRGGFDCLYCAK